MAFSYLDLIVRGAPVAAYDDGILEATRRGASEEEIERLERDRTAALVLRDRLAQHRLNESVLRTINDTANDLAALRELDPTLDAITARARTLLSCDLAYISLSEAATGDSYVRAANGNVSTALRELRLPAGSGLGGKVARTGVPCCTINYRADRTLVHTPGIDATVIAERIVALLGVPLRRDGRVIGVLMAAQCEERTFSTGEINALVLLANHAAVAIENARLAELERTHTQTLERSADIHVKLTRVVLHGGGIDDVVAAAATAVPGAVCLYDERGVLLSAAGGDAQPGLELGLTDQVLTACEHGATINRDGVCVVPMITETGPLGALAHIGSAEIPDPVQRSLERAALVASLVLVTRRRAAEAESRSRATVLEDLLHAEGSDLEPIHDRARLLNVDLTKDGVLLVLSGRPDHRERLQAAAAAVARRNKGLLTYRCDDVVLWLPSPDTADDLATVTAEIARAVGAKITCGHSAVTGIDRVAHAFAEAYRCVQVLRRVGRDGETLSAADLGFLGLLLSDDPRPGHFVDSTIGPVIRYDEERGTDLIGTLAAYHHAGQTQTATAQALLVHVNTVSQRLARITELLGPNWRTPDRMLEIQVALQVHQAIPDKVMTRDRSAD